MKAPLVLPLLLTAILASSCSNAVQSASRDVARKVGAGTCDFSAAVRHRGLVLVPAAYVCKMPGGRTRCFRYSGDGAKPERFPCEGAIPLPKQQDG